MQFGIPAIIAIIGAVFSIVELGLTAYVDDHTWDHATISFMVFNSVWSLLVLAYIIAAPLYVPRIYNKAIALALEIVTMLFWIGGSIAYAVLWRGCDFGYFCGNTKAGTVFGFLLWLIFLVLAVLDGLDWSKNRHMTKGPHNAGV